MAAQNYPNNVPSYQPVGPYTYPVDSKGAPIVTGPPGGPPPLFSYGGNDPNSNYGVVNGNNGQPYGMPTYETPTYHSYSTGDENKYIGVDEKNLTPQQKQDLIDERKEMERQNPGSSWQDIEEKKQTGGGDAPDSKLQDTANAASIGQGAYDMATAGNNKKEVVDDPDSPDSKKPDPNEPTAEDKKNAENDKKNGND